MSLLAEPWRKLPEAVAFNWIPVATSLVVALGGLLCGWLAYRKVTVPAEDRLQIPLLKNKYYFDEIYAFLFVRPAGWIAEKFTSLVHGPGGDRRRSAQPGTFLALPGACLPQLFR